MSKNLDQEGQFCYAWAVFLLKLLHSSSLKITVLLQLLLSDFCETLAQSCTMQLAVHGTYGVSDWKPTN